MKNKLQAIRSKEEGFTLVELLVVLVIVAVLATLAVVLLTGRADDARVTVADSNLDSGARIAQTKLVEDGNLTGLGTDLDNGLDIPVDAGATTTNAETLYYELGDPVGGVTFRYDPGSGTDRTLVVASDGDTTGPS